MSSAATTAGVMTATGERRGAAGTVTLAYGLFCYAAFLATFAYMVGFVGNWIVPKTIDSGASGELIPSMLINAALMVVFVLQHTIMARPAFKRAWTRIVPSSAERSTFVLLASASLALMFWQWQPLPQVIWRLDGAAGVAVAVLSLSGWLFVFVSSLAISHMDLFGVRQAWLRFRERPYVPVGFRIAGVYRLVRHPLMLGFLVAAWSAPTMTIGRLSFAVMITAYIVFGVWMEERDLVAEFGDGYVEYRRRVPGILPLPRTVRSE